jgi:hypothetical protein
MSKNLTRAAFEKTIISCNDTYIARTPAPKLNEKTGLNNDIETALRFLSKISDDQFNQISAIGLEKNFLKSFKENATLKDTKRLIQIMQFMVGFPAHKCLQVSARTFVLTIAGMISGHAKSREALEFICSGRGDDNTSSEIDVAVALKLSKIFGKSSKTNTKTEFAVAKSMGKILGVCSGGGKNQMFVINDESTFLKHLMTRISQLTEFETDELSKKAD